MASWRLGGSIVVCWLLACSGNDPAGSPSQGSGSGGSSGSGASGGEASGASGGASAGSSAGGTSAAGTSGAGGDTAGSGAGGSAGSGPSNGCGTTLASKSANTKTVVSDKIIDYALEGSPAAEHFNVALLLFDGTSRSTTPDPDAYDYTFYTPEQLGDAFFNDPNGVHAYLAEASFGKVSLSGRVVGWIELASNNTPAQEFQTNREQYAALAAEYLDLADYDITYIVALTDVEDQLQIGWDYKSNQLGGVIPMGIDWMINSRFWKEAGGAGLNSLVLPSTSWAHELQHTFGIDGHANSYNCGTETLGPAENCTIVAYGNPFSLMGEYAYGTHADALMKERLGWLEPSQMIQVTSSGTYTLCPLETADGKPKGLTIQATTPRAHDQVTFDKIHVEYRRPLGFDRYLSRLDGTDGYLARFKPEGSVRSDGVLVSLGYENPDVDTTVLLDAHPTTSYNEAAGVMKAGNTGKFADALLAVGETLDLSSMGVSITTEALTDDGGVVVRVDYE
jgi:hypothetical protein